MRSPRPHARRAAPPRDDVKRPPAVRNVVATAEMKKEVCSVTLSTSGCAVGPVAQQHPSSAAGRGGAADPISPGHRLQRGSRGILVGSSLDSVFAQAHSTFSASSEDDTLQSSAQCPRCGLGAGACYWNRVANQGKSFLKIVAGAYTKRLVFCQEFSDKFTGMIGPWVSLKSNSGRWYTVKVSMHDGVHFFDDGWPAVAETEELLPGDYAIFTYVSTYEMAMHLYHPKGIEKASTIIAHPRDICVVPNTVIGAGSCDPLPHETNSHAFVTEAGPSTKRKRTRALALERANGVVLDDDQFGRVMQIWTSRSTSRGDSRSTCPGSAQC
ncbi:hypothetical protein ACP70R_046031 [Stipagrostis hirtigluma subsp. patula]